MSKKDPFRAGSSPILLDFFQGCYNRRNIRPISDNFLRAFIQRTQVDDNCVNLVPREFPATVAALLSFSRVALLLIAPEGKSAVVEQ